MSFYSQYPASSASSNASIGVNGATAPTSSTEVAGIGPTGLLTPVQTDAAGDLITVPLTKTASGTITAANQSVMIATTGYGSVGFNVEGTFVGTLILEGSADGINWDFCRGFKPSTNAPISTVTAICDLCIVQVSGMQAFRLIASPWTSGSATIYMNCGPAAADLVQANIFDSNGSSVTIGQKLGGFSLPVVIASDQTNLPVIQQNAGINFRVQVDTSALPSGAATSSNQTSQITQETAIAGSTSSIDTKSTTISTNTGNTATSVASIDTKTPTVGQKAMAASSPVVLASDQTSIPVAATLQASSAVIGHVIVDAGSAVIGHVIADAGSAIIGKVGIDQTTPGTTNGVQVNAALPAGTNVIGAAIGGTLVTTGTVSSATDIFAAVDVSAYASISLQLVLTGTATITFRGSNDGVNFRDISFASSGGGGSPSTVALSSSIVTAPVMFKYFKPVVTSYTNGSITATMVNTQGVQSYPGLGAPSRSWNMTSVSDSVTVQPGNTANTTAWLVTQKGLASSNAPITNDYSSVNVTTGAYVQLIASTTAATTFIDIFDSSGQPMILATGGAGSEVVLAYIPPGGDSFSIAIPASTRVAYKALTATASTGTLIMNLRG